MISGFINLYKPQGITSAKAIGMLKRSLKTLGFNEKIGHMGTLDPLAEGVLPVAIGRATRLFDYFLNKEKAYRAEFIFGAESPTLDTDSEVVYHEYREIDIEELKSAASEFCGAYEQIPPIYSAKSINGVRAYKLARNGEIPELKAKEVHIFELNLLKKTGYGRFSFYIKCSSGTYIRSIGRDIAELLGTTAVMCSLVRLESGPFAIENSCDLRSVRCFPEHIKDYLLPMDSIINFTRIDICEDELKLLRNGIKLDSSKFIIGSEKYYAVYYNDNIVGIGAETEEKKFYIKTWLM